MPMPSGFFGSSTSHSLGSNHTTMAGASGRMALLLQGACSVAQKVQVAVGVMAHSIPLRGKTDSGRGREGIQPGFWRDDSDPTKEGP